MIKNIKFDHKSKFSSKKEMLTKNRNFRRKRDLDGKKENFDQKSKFWPKIKILAQNFNFGRKF